MYFWLKEDCKGEESCDRFEAAMEKLLEIGTIASGIWGRQAGTPERPVTDKTWDYALSLKFESLVDHDSYQDDPGHHEFVEGCRELWAKVLVMDVG